MADLGVLSGRGIEMSMSVSVWKKVYNGGGTVSVSMSISSGSEGREVRWYGLEVTSRISGVRVACFGISAPESEVVAV